MRARDTFEILDEERGRDALGPRVAHLLDDLRRHLVAIHRERRARAARHGVFERHAVAVGLAPRDNPGGVVSPLAVEPGEPLRFSAPLPRVEPLTRAQLQLFQQLLVGNPAVAGEGNRRDPRGLDWPRGSGGRGRRGPAEPDLLPNSTAPSRLSRESTRNESARVGR